MKSESRAAKPDRNPYQHWMSIDASSNTSGTSRLAPTEETLKSQFTKKA